MTLDAKVPGGPLADKWDRHRFESKLVNPANRRKYTVIIVGTGLAGASAASSLGELGYNVLSFCIHDSPRRAHSIAAQGGINAAKNYQNDGDSIQRLFYDTIKGGDYRSREANVYRLAQLSVNIIDQCVAQGVPFAREYGGLLDNRSFGGAQVSRTFYARGQTGQQLLLGAYQSMMRQVERGTVTMFANREMLDLVVVNGQARGIICRNLITGAIERYVGARGAALHRRLRHGLLPLDQRRELERHGRLARAQARRVLRQPLLHADSPDLHSGVGHAPVEADADEREPAQRRPRLGAEEPGRPRSPDRDSRSRARLLPRAPLSELRQPRAARRRVAQRQVGLRRRTRRRRERPGRLSRLRGCDQAPRRATSSAPATATCSTCTARSPTRIRTACRCGSIPAIHYTMGGLWVDYNLMSTIPGLHVLGEANFSDHGANRLGASALMQGLADGYFVIPYTLAHYLEQLVVPGRSRRDHDAFAEAEAAVQARIDRLLSVKGSKTPRQLHRELGALLWDEVGMSRNDAGLRRALDAHSRAPRRVLAERLGAGTSRTT